MEPGLLGRTQAGPQVDAGQQDVQGPARRRARGTRVDPPDVAVDVAGQRPAAASDQQHDCGYRTARNRQCALLPRPPACGNASHQLLLDERRAAFAPRPRMPDPAGCPGWLRRPSGTTTWRRLPPAWRGSPPGWRRIIAT